ncbi:MAG: ATP-binding protein, partial [Oscillospiraceae bacterium]|nr:ATP-binding protein [Oscillospiraceae bacterium]
MVTGREGKIDSMEKNWASSGAKFVVVYGSHKSGKTEVLSAFAEGKRGIFFSAQRLNSYMNLRLFEKAVSEFSGEEEDFPTWKVAFKRIGEFCKEERFLLAIDDFADLVFEDRNVLKDFRNAFENEWRNSNIYVAAGCGRVYFTENEILAENSASSIRRPVICKLEELDYLDSAKLLPKETSAIDKMRYYCCLGGVPEYLGLVEGGKTFEENIRNIFLKKEAPLFNEPPMLFLDELREPEFYNSILFALAKGSQRINEIVAETGESSTKVNKYLLTLLQMQIVNRDIPFGEENKSSRKGIYTISSKALAFWFKFVLPNKTAISTGKEVFENLTEEIDSYIDGKLYEQVCMQYMFRKNKQGMLPFLSSVMSGYWSSLKEYSDAKLVAANQRNRQILFAEYRRSYSEPGEQLLSRLRKNDKLFTEYWERFDMLFSIEAFPREIRNLENIKLKLVDVEGLYK